MNEPGSDFEAALRRVLDDDELISRFWHRGYKELVGHAGDGTKQWIGQRVIAMISGSLIAAGVWLGFKFGGWGK